MERNLLNISLSQGSSSAWEFLATSGILPLRCCKLDSSVSDESLERSTFRAQRRDAYGSTSCTRHPAPGQGVGRGDTMGLLRLAVLGPPEVVHDGRRLTFGLRKAEALLLYLAVEGGMHPRSKLAAFLWPDSAPHAARTPLRNALVLLRRLLANPDASPAPHSHLLAEQDLLGLNPQAPVELDLEVVQRAYTEAQRHSTLPAEPQRAALAAKFQQALTLVRGLPATPDAPPPPHSHVLAEWDLLGLTPQAPVELGLGVVQRAYTGAQGRSTLPAEPQRAALAAKFQQALTLVRGPFLDGFWLGEESPFDEWVLQAQQQWQGGLHLLPDRLSPWPGEGRGRERARGTLTRSLA